MDPTRKPHNSPLPMASVEKPIVNAPPEPVVNSNAAKPVVKTIAVFCGSSKGSKDSYVAAAQQLGTCLAKRGIGLVYGGGSLGLMGAVSAAVHSGGQSVCGVIPRVMDDDTYCGPTPGEKIVVESMHERKALMASKADAFIALPGGYGTLEEIIEMATWQQLGVHQKPVGVLNVSGFWNPFISQLETMVAEGFLAQGVRQSFCASADADELLDVMLSKMPAKGYFDWKSEDL